MRKATVEIFSDATNATVIRHPERRSPGVLVQGDTLYVVWNVSSRRLPWLEAAWTAERPEVCPWHHLAIGGHRVRPGPGYRLRLKISVQPDGSRNAHRPRRQLQYRSLIMRQAMAEPSLKNFR